MRMMTQSFYGNANNGFREYLASSMSNMFTLDLTNCTVIECINKMCEIKERSHPKIKQNYRMLVNKLEDIEQQFGCTIMPAMISSVFWNHFIPFLADQGLKYSTIGHVKANLIAVLNWSSKYGVKLNPSYSEVDIPNYIPSKISLTPDEISHIYHFKIGQEPTYSFRSKKVLKLRKNKIETLERVRDMFVLGCNLGQRYSDLVRISPENFRNGQFSIVQQKTGNKCFVPINSLSIDSRITFAILEKYGYHAPYTGDINNYNSYLHQLLYHIGEDFLEEIHIDNKINGVIMRETKHRYQLISSHSARRSFATINTLRNIPRSKILRATGHSSEKAFVRYICYDEEN
jgi:integrase